MEKDSVDNSSVRTKVVPVLACPTMEEVPSEKKTGSSKLVVIISLEACKKTIDAAQPAHYVSNTALALTPLRV